MPASGHPPPMFTCTGEQVRAEVQLRGRTLAWCRPDPELDLHPRIKEVEAGGSQVPSQPGKPCSKDKKKKKIPLP